MKLWLFRYLAGPSARSIPDAPSWGFWALPWAPRFISASPWPRPAPSGAFRPGSRRCPARPSGGSRAPGRLSAKLFIRGAPPPGVRAAAPVVESVLELSGPHRGPVLLLGIDPFSEKDFRDYEFVPGSDLGQPVLGRFSHPSGAVLVSDRLAARLQLQAGDTLPVLVGPARKSLGVAGIFRSPSGLYPLEGAGSPDGYRRGPGTPGPGGEARLYRPHRHRGAAPGLATQTARGAAPRRRSGAARSRRAAAPRGWWPPTASTWRS